MRQKELYREIKEALFRYINIVYNISESSDMFFAIQILNSEEFLYDIVYEIEKIANLKKADFYTIDLSFEDFGLNEIDSNGEYIIPPWLKNKNHSIILVYNIDILSNKNYKIKQMQEILINGKANNIKIPSNKHFILLSNKKIGDSSNVMRIDIKKAITHLKKDKRG